MNQSTVSHFKETSVWPEYRADDHQIALRQGRVFYNVTLVYLLHWQALPVTYSQAKTYPRTLHNIELVN